MTEHAYIECLAWYVPYVERYSGVNTDLIRGNHALTLSRYNADNDKIDLYFV